MHLAIAAAVNLVRVVQWLWEGEAPKAKEKSGCRVRPSPFGALALARSKAGRVSSLANNNLLMNPNCCDVLYTLNEQNCNTRERCKTTESPTHQL